jgi:Co/Zn/Cd efflux system component
MTDCCQAVAVTSQTQRRVLLIVLWINAAMFVVELGAALLAGSTALLADSVDMLGDAIVYGFSLYVLGRGPAWQARAARTKGLVMAAFGIAVLAEVVVKIVRGVVPGAAVMAEIGLLALVANLVCLLLLWRRRGDDLNMRSAWLCSRNDVTANASVLVAAAGVSLTGSAWPDIAVGLLIAAMFVSSAVGVIRAARSTTRALPAG